MNEKIVEDAMNIIILAGDARVSCTSALNEIADGNIEKAKELLKEAKKKIAEAHRIQTDDIQKAIGDGDLTYNPLFSHAQDTLMTIYSEINIAKQLIHIFEKYEDRISALENETR